MAVYVLLTFEKDEDAKVFVENTLRDGQVSSKEGDLFADDLEWADATVRGVWKKPTLFCTKEKPGCSSRSRGSTRGKKYGWWVCTGCGKPTKLWAQGNAWFTALGTNLLPQSETAPEYRPPGGDPKVLWDFLPKEILTRDPLAEWVFKNDPRTGTVDIVKVPKL